MSAARRRDPEARRGQLVAAAARCFREKSVSGTAVSDIVRRAGVAQGTFYLYFESKDEIVTAVISAALDAQMERVSRAVDVSDATAIQKLLVLRDALIELRDEPHEQEALQIFHRPENREIHDRISAEFAEKMVPHVCAIIEQGVAEGVFDVLHPETAARFISGGLVAADSVESDLVGEGAPAPDEVGSELMRYVMRSLGCS